jgi:hypothetical protein
MSGQKSEPQSLAHAFALLMSEGDVMPSARHRRLQKLMRHIADAQHPWLHEHGLASLLAWDQAHPESSDEPSSGYGGVGLTQLLTPEERQVIL